MLLFRISFCVIVVAALSVFLVKDEDLKIMFMFLCSTVLHDSKLTHTDLKPENILFVNSDFTMSFNVEKVGCN